MESQIYMSGPSITQYEIERVVEMMKNGWYGENAYACVELFEKLFASYHERKFSLMTPNCTTAIHLILMALGIGKNDEVIVPEITWIATAAPIHYVGATPVFSDVNLHNWCIDIENIKKKLTKKTKAIIAVDIYGNMPNYTELIDLCNSQNIVLIEDSAEALGSKYLDKKAGSFGTASVFSFHRTKTLTTGEGGMLLMDDENLFNRSKILRDHGRAPGSYFNTEIGYKYMPSNLAASLGLAQFERIDELIKIKRNIYELYKSLINDEYCELNPENEQTFNSVWSTVMLVKEERKIRNIIEEFAENRIPVRPFFQPLSSLPAFEKYKSSEDKNNVNSECLFRRGLCLPSSMNLEESQITNVANIINKVLASNK